MTVPGQFLKLRLFIEGIEIPIISAQVQMQPNGPATCTIQIPPSPWGTKLHPRSTVHVFFADIDDYNPLHVSLRGRDEIAKNKNPTAYEQTKEKFQNKAEDSPATWEYVNDTRNVRYKLLFCGEFIAYSHAKSPFSRSLTLQCVDFSNYWDYAYQFNNTDIFGPGIKAVFSGGATNLLTDFLSSPGEIVAGLLHQKSVQYPGIPGVLGGVVRILEAIGGAYYTDTKFAGQNIFFSIAELRLHITQMITAFPDDDSARKFLGGGGLDGMFGRSLGNLGEQVSIRKAINAIMGLIYHEVYPVTTAMYVPGSDGTVTGQKRRKISNVPELADLYSTAVIGQETLDDVIELVAVPAKVIQDDFRKALQTNLIRLDRVAKSCQVSLNTARQKKIKLAEPLLTNAHLKIRKAAQLLKNYWSPKSAPSAKANEASKLLKEAKAELKKLEDLDINVTPLKKQLPARLNSHIFKPDIWFGPPPRCNVIFPDRYFNANFQRSFLNEPTRLLLKVHDEFFGENELTDAYYVTPKLPTVKKSKKLALEYLSGDIMEHELFTGIIPVFEKMGQFNIYAIRTGKVKGKNPKVGLAQRSANFMYFKYRFGARSMTISSMFNPYLAVGFPALVMDRYVNDADVLKFQNGLKKNGGKKTEDLSPLLGTHFLGYITGMSHSISQTDAQTQIELGFAREYNELTKFMGPFLVEDQVVQKRYGKNTVRETIVAALDVPAAGAVGPNFGTITGVKEVTDAYSTRATDIITGFITQNPGAELPIFTTKKAGAESLSPARVPINVPRPANQFGPEAVALAGGNPYREITFRAFIITEEIPKYRQDIVDLPPEEYIRPGWYSDMYHPSKIGEPYKHFLGVGSITDKTQLTETAGTQTVADIVGSNKFDEVDGLEQKFMDDPRARTTAPSVLQLDLDSSIENAVDFLIQAYSYIRSNGLSIQEFIRAYTHRPIATMVDMFGTNDLQYDERGEKVVRGIEGLHSKAFSPVGNLFGLVPPEIDEVLEIGKKSKSGAVQAERIDVRPQKWEKAKALQQSLLTLRGLLG